MRYSQELFLDMFSNVFMLGSQRTLALYAGPAPTEEDLITLNTAILPHSANARTIFENQIGAQHIVDLNYPDISISPEYPGFSFDLTSPSDSTFYSTGEASWFMIYDNNGYTVPIIGTIGMTSGNAVMASNYITSDTAVTPSIVNMNFEENND